MNLLEWSVVFFAVAAFIGFYLLSLVLRKKETRKGLAFIHGPLAAIGLIMLICYSIQHRHNELILPIVLLVITALGGFVMIGRDLMGRLPPRWLAVLHGILAISGVGLVLVFIWGV